MRKTLAAIRDAHLGAGEAARRLQETLAGNPGQIVLLAAFVCAALAGAPVDPESLPPPEDFL